MCKPTGAFTSAMLLLCICSVRMLQATPVGDGQSPRSSRDARSYFPFGLGAPDHVHYYPEQHHHHHFADYAHSGFPGFHHDAHYHLDTVVDHHQHHHHHHHDLHAGHFDQHYY